MIFTLSSLFCVNFKMQNGIFLELPLLLSIWVRGLMFTFLGGVEIGSDYVAQASHKLMTLLPNLPSAGITGMHPHPDFAQISSSAD
jgi:hypothetical protein